MYHKRGTYAADRQDNLFLVVEVVHDNELQTYLVQPVCSSLLPVPGTLPHWVGAKALARGERPATSMAHAIVTATTDAAQSANYDASADEVGSL